MDTTTVTATSHLLNWTDFTIIGIVAVSTLISLVRGFVREAISLLTWVVAFWIAFKFTSIVATFFGNYIKTPSFRLILAFALIFIIVLILGGLVNFLISELINHTGLSGTDRVLGMVFGITRGVLLISVLILLGEMTAFHNDPWWQNSTLIPHFHSIVNWLHGLLPEKLTNFSAVEQITR
jgi:membrane protein required for colicin V production